MPQSSHNVIAEVNPSFHYLIIILTSFSFYLLFILHLIEVKSAKVAAATSLFDSSLLCLAQTTL